MIDLNSTAQLLGAFGVIDRVKPALLDTFFPMEQTFDTEEVYFDKVQRARKLAAFVSPTVAGKADRSRGYATEGFKPPYVKPKHVIEPLKNLKRRAGEQILGSLSPEQRFELSMADNMFIEDEEITRREEWMAVQLLTTGAMTCQSEDHPPIVVDLQRNSAHTIALTGAARWGQSGVDPLQNLRSWATTVSTNSGFHPRTVFLDPLAAEFLIDAPGVLRIMQSFRQQRGDIDLSGAVTGAIGEEVQYLGSVPMFDFFQYQQLYADDTGTVQQFMPDNTVIMGNKVGCQGIRTYGAILDGRNLMPLPRFPKVWMNEDPSAWFTMTQSSPLPLLGWIDATFCATVN
jgi:hypothetical protein